tara:strand:+ start:3399 stop:3641 length:243 start_codon:yes stop_codon:yes gene_type:complete
MIDTDKYKGHYTDDFARFWVTADDELNADIERANATTNLIDDAPRLLAEVKRLRKAIIKVAFDEHESVFEMKHALVRVIE